MEADRIIEALHPLERAVLPLTQKHSDFDSLVRASKLKDVEVMRALQWLENKNLVKTRKEEFDIISLDKNGVSYLKEGLPEKRLLQSVKAKPLSIEEIEKATRLSREEVNASIGLLKSKAAIEISKDKNLAISITENGKQLLAKETLEEKFLKKDFPVRIEDLRDEEKYAFSALKSRKNIISIDKKKIITISLTPIGSEAAKQSVKAKEIIDKITPDILKLGKWKNKSLRRYDVKINVPQIYPSRRHFVNEAVDYIKKIWLELGFKEMSGNIIQTAFWDLDSLFVPQDHPARELQDTFYIKGQGKLPPICKKIRAVHENGSNTKSKGWQYKYSEEEAKKLLLRTHTTVLSAQTLAALKEEDLPAKFFAVGKVFRNETLNASHLFEFYQVEGIVIDPNANFRHLIGYLKEFFTKMGYSDIRIRPAHFPYVEPGAEIEVYHPKLKKWIELAGAGIFRPEVVIPLLGKDVPVLAWGMGLDRIISAYYGITDIRDLYKNDLKQLKESKIWLTGTI